MAIRALTLAVLFASFIGVSDAAEELDIEGIYGENGPCDAKSANGKVPKVVIGSTEILHAGGTCSIDSRRQERKNLVMQVTCTFRSGAVMMAEIAFWRRDDATLGMEQRDGAYQAILHKCPN